MTEASILERLRQPGVDRKDRMELLTKLESVGGAAARAYLEREAVGYKDGLDEYRDYALAKVRYRLAEDSEKIRILASIIRDHRHHAWGWAVIEAGDLGSSGLLAPLQEITGQQDASRSIRKIRLLNRYSRAVAYLVASQCNGSEDTDYLHTPCQMRIWGFEKLGTVKEPWASAYLRRSLVAFERELRELELVPYDRVDRMAIESVHDYFDVIRRTLQSMGYDHGPIPWRWRWTNCGWYSSPSSGARSTPLAGSHAH